MDSNFSIHQWRDSQVKDRVNEESSVHGGDLDKFIEFHLGYLQSFRIFVERLKSMYSSRKRNYDKDLQKLEDFDELLRKYHTNPEVKVDNLGDSTKYNSTVGKVINGAIYFDRRTGGEHSKFLKDFKDWLTDDFGGHMSFLGMYDHEDELGTEKEDYIDEADNVGSSNILDFSKPFPHDGEIDFELGGLSNVEGSFQKVINCIKDESLDDNQEKYLARYIAHYFNSTRL